MNDDAEKLKGFLFFIIDEHKAACRKQAKAMQKYVDVLGERIKDLIDNG